MSGKVVGMVFDHYPGKGGELLLAVKLADNSHDDGTSIYPAVATLADLTRQSERTVQYQIRKMVDMGWLVLVREARGGGRGGGFGRPREYRIHPDFIWQHSDKMPNEGRPVWVARVETPSKEMGAISAPILEKKWVQPSVEMGATAVAEMGAIAVAPEPSLTVIEPNTPQPPTGGDGGFGSFFSIFPKQVDIDKAREQWDRLSPGDVLQGEIAAAVLAWRQSPLWLKEGGSLVPKPHNWLRNKGWLNVPGIASMPRPPAPPPVPEVPRAPLPESVKAYRAGLAGVVGGRPAGGVRASARSGGGV